MNNILKGKAKYISASIGMALIIAVTVGAADKLHFTPQIFKTLTTDTIPNTPKSKPVTPGKRKMLITDSVIKKDTLLKSNRPDTDIISQKVDTFNFKISKDTLAAPVYYLALRRRYRQ